MSNPGNQSTLRNGYIVGTESHAITGQLLESFTDGRPVEVVSDLVHTQVCACALHFNEVQAAELACSWFDTTGSGNLKRLCTLQVPDFPAFPAAHPGGKFVRWVIEVRFDRTFLADLLHNVPHVPTAHAEWGSTLRWSWICWTCWICSPPILRC